MQKDEEQRLGSVVGIFVTYFRSYFESRRRSEGEEKLRRRTIVTTENYVVLSYACAFISRNVDVAML
ncbi:hypothetical protein U1Q18_048058 [Sarracenia purpurea var. burkii]